MGRNRLGAAARIVALWSFSLTLFAGVAAKQPASEAVFGMWETPMMDAVITIDRCGERLCATLVRHDYEQMAQTDIKNPDPALRGRPLLGLRIIEGLKAVKRGKWRGGVFYDPRTGRSYTPKIKLIDRNRVKISGCIGPGLCKGYVWTRVDG